MQDNPDAEYPVHLTRHYVIGLDNYVKRTNEEADKLWEYNRMMGKMPRSVATLETER